MFTIFLQDTGVVGVVFFFFSGPEPILKVWKAGLTNQLEGEMIAGEQVENMQVWYDHR